MLRDVNSILPDKTIRPGKINTTAPEITAEKQNFPE